MTNWLRGAWRVISALRQFIHFSVLGFSIILPLLGAATVSSRLTSYQVLGLIGAAVTFHIFAYVLNDVIDLPLDRTQPLRAGSPLVQGKIQPWLAQVVALFQIPLALAFTYLLAPSSLAYVAIGSAFILMTAYNVWGKRIAFPPLTDVIQGLGFGAMVLYGAAAIPGRPSGILVVIFAFVIVFIVMINGIHGSLRDLANDLNYGARTTAILLGVRPSGINGLILPLRFRLYALALQVLLIGIILIPLFYNWFGYPLMTWTITIGILLIFILLSLILLVVSAGSIDNRSRLNFLGMLHISISLSSLLVLFAAYLSSGVLELVLVIYLVPICSNKILWDRLTRRKISYVENSLFESVKGDNSNYSP
jgi:4-hydroxybenzoate polyprenyltransferase